MLSSIAGFQREQKTYLDDDLTQLQLEGRHSLAVWKASIKGQGHETWWRCDVLWWADASDMHRQILVATCSLIVHICLFGARPAVIVFRLCLMS